MDREIRIALGVAAGIAGLVIGFIFLVRYAVPAILEAHFAGSLITASVVGIAGILLLVWAGWKLWAWAAQALKR
jgi:threonine/homoserine/homoserine lactone efflux protein